MKSENWLFAMNADVISGTSPTEVLLFCCCVDKIGVENKLSIMQILKISGLPSAAYENLFLLYDMVWEILSLNNKLFNRC